MCSCSFRRATAALLIRPAAAALRSAAAPAAAAADIPRLPPVLLLICILAAFVGAAAVTTVLNHRRGDASGNLAAPVLGMAPVEEDGGAVTADPAAAADPPQLADAAVDALCCAVDVCGGVRTCCTQKGELHISLMDAFGQQPDASNGLIKIEGANFKPRRGFGAKGLSFAERDGERLIVCYKHGFAALNELYGNGIGGDSNFSREFLCNLSKRLSMIGARKRDQMGPLLSGAVVRAVNATMLEQMSATHVNVEDDDASPRVNRSSPRASPLTPKQATVEVEVQTDTPPPLSLLAAEEQERAGEF